MTPASIQVPGSLPQPSLPVDSDNRLIVGASMCYLLAVIITGIMAGVPLAGAAIAGPLAFWAICWYRPEIALAMIFASCPFQTDLTAGMGPVRFSIAEVQLFLALPVFAARAAVRKQRISVGPLLIPLLLYLIACIASAFVKWRDSDAIVSLVQVVQNLIFGVILFAFLPDDRRNLRWGLYGLVVSGLLLAAFVAQPVVNPFAMNKNGLGAAMAFPAIVCGELWISEKIRWRRWALGIALVVLSGALVITLSRGAWISAAAGIMVIVVLRKRYRLMLQIAAVMIPVAAVCWHFLPEESREYATGFEAGRQNIRLRYESIDYAIGQFRTQPLFGVGVGLRKEYDATNIVLLTLAETGAVGFAAFMLLHAAVLRTCWEAFRRLPKGDPLGTPVVVGAALLSARFAHGLVDHYWGRGSNTLAWTAVGMALGVWSQVRMARSAPAPVEWMARPLPQLQSEGSAAKPRTDKVGAEA